jgi:hypothetical protein
MIDCYGCKARFFARRKYIAHLKDCHFTGKIKYPLKCNFSGCENCEFGNFDYLNKHLKQFHEQEISRKEYPINIPVNNLRMDKNQLIHSTETYSSVLDQMIGDSTMNLHSKDCDSYDFDNAQNNNEKDNKNRIDFDQLINGNFNKLLEDNLLRVILEFKSNLALSESLFNKIYETFSDLITLVLNHLCILLEHTEIESEKLYKLIKEVINYQEMFKSFNTSYKQLKLINHQKNYVKSQTKHYDARLERVQKKGVSQFVVKSDSFEYISIIDTVKRLLNDDQYCLEIRNNNSKNASNNVRPMYNDLVPFWNNENTLKIILFHDEIELANPLGDASCVYKLDNYYFKILNLSSRHNSMLKNIHCIASTFSDDIKKNGNDPILKSIVQEVKILETQGVLINNTKYYGSIYQVCGDNLGIHQIFGL